MVHRSSTGPIGFWKDNDPPDHPEKILPEPVSSLNSAGEWSRYWTTDCAATRFYLHKLK